MKLGYLGPGTNSENAAREYAAHVAGLGLILIPYSGMEQVFDALGLKEADLIVVPIRNSITGDIGYKKLAERRGLRKIDEFVIPIRHCIAAKRGAVNLVELVVSHEEVLRQCKGYLDRNFPHWERISAESTNRAAKMASEEGRLAAIAGLETCIKYGLKIIKRDIIKENYSTFWVLGLSFYRSKKLYMNGKGD
jgi:prephenate dehydratase